MLHMKKTLLDEGCQETRWESSRDGNWSCATSGGKSWNWSDNVVQGFAAELRSALETVRVASNLFFLLFFAFIYEHFSDFTFFCDMRWYSRSCQYKKDTVVILFHPYISEMKQIIPELETKFIIFLYLQFIVPFKHIGNRNVIK